MLVKPNKLVNTIIPYGKTGAVTQVFESPFRTFSVHNVSGTCTVTIGGNAMVVPVGVTVDFDAGTENGVINKFRHNSFEVVATDCIIVGTL